MQMSILIRPLKESDIEACAELFYETVHAVNSKDYTQTQVDAWAPEVADVKSPRWQSLLKNISFVAEMNNELVGFIDMTHDGYLDHAFVHKNHQGKGIATALFQKLEQQALELGISEIFTEASITAKPHAEAKGFKVVKEQQKHFNGVEFINYVMKKSLLDFTFPMPIVTPRLILRPPQIGDGKVLNEAVLESFDLLNAFMDWAKVKPSLEDSEEIVRQAVENWILKKNDEPYLMLLIFHKDTGQFIGATGYHHYHWDVPSLETGYWIRTSYAGKGFMTEAINALTQYAFKQLKVNRLTITCDSDNLRSKNIPEKLGYTLEGRLKNHRRKPLTKALGDTLIYTRIDLNHLPELIVTWGEPCVNR